jgi:hypothetical protein
VLVLVLAASSCAAKSREVPPEEGPRNFWTRGAESPLSPRWGALMASLGSSLVIIGGWDTVPCPPGADCASPGDPLRDGAYYGPDSDEWQPIAAAPVGLSRDTPHAVLRDGELVVVGRDGWYVYTPSEDEWLPLPAPPGGAVDLAQGPETKVTLYAVDRHRRIQVLDVGRRTWSVMTTDNLKPRLSETALFPTEDGAILLSGVNYDEAAPDEPTLTQVDVWDGRRWRRLRSGQIGPFYHWTGQRLVGLEQGGADGGEVNGWATWYPFGGALDPATGTWRPVDGLPGTAKDDPYWDSTHAWTVEAAQGPMVATGGRVYDESYGTWTEPGRPDSAVDDALSAAFADDGRLVFFGGFDTDAGWRSTAGLSNELWIWHP